MISKTDAGLYETEIDGKKYEFSKWGAEESLTTLLKIAKIAGKPLGMAIGAIMDGDAEASGLFDKKMSPDLLGLVFEALTDRLDETIVVALVKKVAAEKVFCDGAKVEFNKHYEDKLEHLFKVVAAGLEVQYGNFFGALLGLVKVKETHKRPKAVSNRAVVN